jgi:hypothetical protein
MTFHEIAGLIEIASIEKDIHGTVYRKPEHSSIHPAKFVFQPFLELYPNKGRLRA